MEVDQNSQYYDFDEEIESAPLPSPPDNNAQSVPAAASFKQNGAKEKSSTEQNETNEDDEMIDTDDEETNKAALWSIDDDTLFQPCGLIHHSSGAHKTVFVTWNEDYLLNFRFKKSKRTKRIEMTKVRIPLPPEAGKIREIHILDYNTLLLMSTGRIYFFSSVKSLHPLSWFSGVRCFSRAANGFSIIRHDQEKQRLLLETYQDVENIGKGESTLMQSYDITYDEQNIFNCDWSDEHFTLNSYTIREEDLCFSKQLFGLNDVELRVGNELHIFSVGGHVFLLMAQSNTENAQQPAYAIELLCVYAAPVSFIKLLPAQNLCLIYSLCGNIDIWYISKLTQLKQRQMHHTGTEFMDFDATAANGDFYYTNAEQLVRLSFQYDAITDDCSVQEEIKHIEGMLVCTWMQQLKQLVCLSVNNIFYKIDFQEQKTTSNELNEDIYKLNDLTLSDLKRLQSKREVLDDYMRQPAQLHAAIEREFQKQQLISVANNTQLYGQLLTAELTYYLQLPPFNNETVLYWTQNNIQLNSESYFALLDFKLKPNNEIFKIAQWKLFVNYQSKVHAMHIDIDLLTTRRCIIVVPLKKQKNSKLPNFELQFGTILQIKSQIRAIMLPVTVEELETTYRGLFSQTTYALNICNELNLYELVQQFKQKQSLNATPTKTGSHFKQKFKLPKNCSFNDVFDTFGFTVTCDSAADTFVLYFINCALNITFDTSTHSLKLSSTDASVIFYFKLHLLRNWSALRGAADEDVLLVEDQSNQLQFVMKLQCEVERFYGSQMQAENTEEEIAQRNTHFEELQRIYIKLRTELG